MTSHKIALVLEEQKVPNKILYLIGFHIMLNKIQNSKSTVSGKSAAQHRRLSVDLLGIDFLGDYP